MYVLGPFLWKWSHIIRSNTNDKDGYEETNKGVMISCKWSDIFLEFNIELNRKNKIQKWNKASKASKQKTNRIYSQISFQNMHVYNDRRYSVKECK